MKALKVITQEIERLEIATVIREESGKSPDKIVKGIIFGLEIAKRIITLEKEKEL